MQQLGVQFATQVTAMVGGDRASLLLTLPATAQMPMLILSNGAVSSTERALAVRDNGLAGLVLRERRPLIIDETDTDRRWFSLSAHEYDAPTRCAMAVPLIWGERVLGVITVTTTQTHLSLRRSSICSNG
ncbi:GAF domain-containing protein [Candidatus Gracilibacteria bacterium]|nr:GAF domain-containing protein [Candidatus Gracilibacteria bacterium]